MLHIASGRTPNFALYQPPISGLASCETTHISSFVSIGSQCD